MRSSPTRSAVADRPCRRSATSSTMPTSPTSSASCARNAAGIPTTRRRIRNMSPRRCRRSCPKRATCAAGRGAWCDRRQPPRRRCAAASKAAPKDVRSKASWCNCAAPNPTSPPPSTPTRADDLSFPSCGPAPIRCGSPGRSSSRPYQNATQSRSRTAPQSSTTSCSSASPPASSCRRHSRSRHSSRAPSSSGISTAPRRRSAPSATAAAPAATPMVRSCATASTRTAGAPWSPR